MNNDVGEIVMRVINARKVIKAFSVVPKASP